MALIVVTESETSDSFSVMLFTLSRFFRLGFGVLPALDLFSRELERPRARSEAEVDFPLVALVADEARRRVDLLVFFSSRDFRSFFFFLLLLLSLDDDEDESLEDDDDLAPLFCLEDVRVVDLLEPPRHASVACPVREQDAHLSVVLSTVHASLLCAPLQIQH